MNIEDCPICNGPPRVRYVGKNCYGRDVYELVDPMTLAEFEEHVKTEHPGEPWGRDRIPEDMNL